jgi:hypothetical protein
VLPERITNIKIKMVIYTLLGSTIEGELFLQDLFISCDGILKIILIERKMLF